MFNFGFNINIILDFGISISDLLFTKYMGLTPKLSISQLLFLISNPPIK